MADDDSTDTGTTPDETSAEPGEHGGPATSSTPMPAEAEVTGMPAVPEEGAADDDGTGSPDTIPDETSAAPGEHGGPATSSTPMPAEAEVTGMPAVPEEGAAGNGATEEHANREQAGEPEPEHELPRFATAFSSPEPTAVIARPRRRATRPSFAAEPVEGSEAALPAPAPAITFVAPSAAEAPAPRRRGRRPAETVEAEVLEYEAQPAEIAPVEERAVAESGLGGSRPRRSRSRRRPDDDEPEQSTPSTEDDLEDVDADGDETDDDTAAGSRRRRRGRRGRGRGRTGEDAVDGDDDSAGEPVAEVADVDEEIEDVEDAGDPDAEDSASSTRRRRRRRRRGSASGEVAVEDSDDDDRPERAGRNGRTTSDDDVRGVAGSTRLEAKRQRRRDGRDTGRRRAPILTESEFLARREAVDRKMVIRQRGERTQIAVLEDDILVEHYVTQASATSFAGNVYLGRVQNVLPSMEAAFIDVGKGRNAVLYAGEVNWDAAGLSGKSRSIETALKSGDKVLVQVTKDPIGHKGARLTQQINLPGRFLVYVPGGSMTGISRKLPDTERQRLKDILKKIVPEDAGVIIRTAAEGASEEELTRDVNRLTAQWEVIQKKAESTSNAPTLLYGEPDLAIRVIRDVFNEDFKELVVQGDDAWDTVEAYVAHVSPELTGRLNRYTGEGDVFRDLRIDEQLAKALDRKVWLPSGGSLVIDRTEAMTVVDVNTGKFIGSGGNLEQTVTRNNMEAAEEIVRQLRLRDVGGIIVIDFIDMVLESNRDLVLRRLTECLGRDRTKHQVAEVTSLGLVQMTRKRVGQGLLEVFSEPCDHCRGRGVIVSTDPVDEKRRSNGSGSPGGGHAAGGSGGGSSRRDRSGPRDAAQHDAGKGAAKMDEAPADAAPPDTSTDVSENAASTGDATGPVDAGIADAGEGGGGRGRRNRGRRGRGSSGEERAAEDAAVVGGTAADEGGAGTTEVADYRLEDSSEDLPPAAQTPVESDVVAVPPAPVESAEEPPDGPAQQPVASDMAVVEVASVEPAVIEETPAAGRPRRRRAASRPAGPPV